MKQTITVVIQEGGSEQLMEELQTQMRDNGWRSIGYNLNATRQSGDGKTPAPAFTREK